MPAFAPRPIESFLTEIVLPSPLAPGDLVKITFDGFTWMQRVDECSPVPVVASRPRFQIKMRPELVEFPGDFDLSVTIS